MTVSDEIRWQVWRRDNFTCQRCGAREFLQIDHIIPRSNGGLDLIGNLQTLCRTCNIDKGAGRANGCFWCGRRQEGFTIVVQLGAEKVRQFCSPFCLLKWSVRLTELEYEQLANWWNEASSFLPPLTDEERQSEMQEAALHWTGI